MTGKPAGGRARRRADIRERLLIAARKLLAEGESFPELSVERLVTEAGIGRSTFYVYFEDKGELLEAWLAEIIDELDQSAARWWALPADADRDAVRVVLDGVLSTYRPHTALMAAAFDAAAYDQRMREAVNRLMQRNIAGMRRHIATGQKAGSIHGELEPAETASWLQWMAERGLHQLVRGATDQQYDRLLDAYTTIIWRTLYATAPSRQARV